ncbi:hypothetical protein C439_15324 [Haloferax mediterranei ATCC 33500]|uniref:Aldo/keto reductase n=1 Tax=Haloferax mediterranei (strain ATCC 33500 / DSM 1411 / JCM 8866 / NBRC 14739 / NCIMB 2177 / R-4) TaxID=523841 RepID=I3R827_HALMT|nr:hypothetical protein HFX_2709 [Haloferax mediterranei ATCC 33500]ELZ99242.1 hypothetical protein C439_15324 [Haloferax mediterranei ATCC 33500]
MNFGSGADWMMNDREASLELLDENLGALEIDLTDDEMARIEAPKTPQGRCRVKTNTL